MSVDAGLGVATLDVSVCPVVVVVAAPPIICDEAPPVDAVDRPLYVPNVARSEPWSLPPSSMTGRSVPVVAVVVAALRIGVIRSDVPLAAGPDPFAVWPSFTPTIGAAARSTKDSTLLDNGAVAVAVDSDVDVLAVVDPVLATRSSPNLALLRTRPDPVLTLLTTRPDRGSSPLPSPLVNLCRSSSPVCGAFQRAAAAPITPPRTEPTTNAALCRSPALPVRLDLPATLLFLHPLHE